MEAQQVQKRSVDEAEALLDGVSAVVVDIEGTTTSLSFVKKVLFPYITENVETYLKNRSDDEETKADICALRELACKDVAEKMEGCIEIPDGESDEVIKCCVENIKWQMCQDRKSTALKQLQGHMWREGYKTGKIKASIYDDVEPVITQLIDEGVSVYVYSSGSIEAQKQLFSHVEEGDISDLFTDFFDTTIGSKTDDSSYTAISEKIHVDPSQILYLTDNPKEGAAAMQAGFKIALVNREKKNPLITKQDHCDFLVISSFGELFGEDEMDHKKLEGNGDLDASDEEVDDDGAELDDDDDDDDEDEVDEEEEDLGDDDD
ncbi:Enolase-phosphatase E1 [Mizuhopecten yessoensis]|uniref:Enolase-phosphatase E1 n=2 Tax=Mizuhopecten yessoensis TaxID=6573 RepID=A0A210PPL1_MIZYE|nr:Enolase-phosphatase E1 [Mizuhopecten yessoensis]